MTRKSSRNLCALGLQGVDGLDFFQDAAVFLVNEHQNYMERGFRCKLDGSNSYFVPLNAHFQ